MAMYNANLVGNLISIDDENYNGDMKLKSIKGDIRLSDLPYNFYDGSAVVLDGEIHVLGSNESSYYKYHYKWDGTSWVSVSTLPYNFYQGSAVVLDGEIHILGGYGSHYSTSYYKYHYKWDGTKWTSVSTLPYNFYDGSAVVLDGEIHILGGSYNDSDYSALYKHYKWDGTSWVSVSTLPYDFYDGSAVVLDGEIHILGTSKYERIGSTDNRDIEQDYTKQYYHYVYKNNIWEKLKDLPYPFSYGGCVVLEGSIYIIGSATIYYSDRSSYAKKLRLYSKNIYILDAITYEIAS